MSNNRKMIKSIIVDLLNGVLCCFYMIMMAPKQYEKWLNYQAIKKYVAKISQFKSLQEVHMNKSWMEMLWN